MSEYRRAADLWAHAWRELARGKADRGHPARTPTLGTIGGDGPELRTVILRDVDPDAGEVEIHADRASAKVAQIAADPRVALHVWSPDPALQIRLRGEARLVHADPFRWADVPDAARAVYGGEPKPGMRLEGPEDHVAEGALERFTAIRVVVAGADLLHLGADRHLRVEVQRRADGWDCAWIAP